MGVHVLTSREGESALYCSTSMFAFGPVFNQDEDGNAFLEWLREHHGVDPRRYSDKELESVVNEWRATLPAEA